MDEKGLIGGTIVDFPYSNLIVVEKNGHKYEIYFDETAGNCGIEELK